MLFHHDPFYVLDHNNRIIDQKTDRQYHGKHGQGVDREAKNVNDRKGAQYHHWNSHGWNNRGTPVLQEQEHDQEHQNNRFDQGLNHTLNRQFNKWCCIKGQLIDHALRIVRT